MPVTPTLISRSINTYIDAHGQTPTYTHAHKKESRNKNIKDTLKQLAYLYPALSPSSKWPQRRLFYNCILTLIRFRIPFITRLCRNEQGAPALYPGTAGTQRRPTGTYVHCRDGAPSRNNEDVFSLLFLFFVYSCWFDCSFYLCLLLLSCVLFFWGGGGAF